jgi:uncharacterized protein involved in exopolysaccharide biosynthesis
MTGTIIPLRLKRDEASALASFDTLATELLAEGRAPNLSVARFDAILTKLRGQRVELASVLADLEARAPSCDAPIEAINAELRDGAREGLAQINLFIQQAETCRTTAERGLLPG